VTILWDAYRSALGSIAQAVGRTPLVTLNRVTAGVTPPIHLKLEWYGATGSLKDRIYLHMFERAEARGDLRPGMRVLECSTGNAGIACAFVAAVKGYRCTIVMPEGTANLCFVGKNRNRLLMTSSQSIYTLYTGAQGAHIT